MTQIEYGLTRDCYVRVSICNALGQTLRVLVDEYQLAGRRTAVWDGKDESGRRAASGVYFCRLNAGGYLENKKMLLLK
jgi:flagellar hook assembly protein FlgD